MPILEHMKIPVTPDSTADTSCSGDFQTLTILQHSHSTSRCVWGGKTFLVWIAIKSRRKIHMTLYLQEGKSSNGQFTGKPVSVCCQVSFSYCWFWTFWPLTGQNSKHQTASVSAYRQKCLLGFCTTLWLVIRHVWAAEKRPDCRYHKCHTLLIVHQ